MVASFNAVDARLSHVAANAGVAVDAATRNIRNDFMDASNPRGAMVPNVPRGVNELWELFRKRIALCRSAGADQPASLRAIIGGHWRQSSEPDTACFSRHRRR